jgi:DNA (cytosine-5)-methyltransferase 1
VTGHVAPAPTEGNGRNGSHRLSSKFVEWMMGYQPGHITSVGLSRNDELKALGNSVVQQQVSLAVRTLLTAEAVAA